jgi:phenolic acid decarboxylase
MVAMASCWEIAVMHSTIMVDVFRYKNWLAHEIYIGNQTLVETRVHEGGA